MNTTRRDFVKLCLITGGVAAVQVGDHYNERQSGVRRQGRHRLAIRSSQRETDSGMVTQTEIGSIRSRDTMTEASIRPSPVTTTLASRSPGVASPVRPAVVFSRVKPPSSLYVNVAGSPSARTSPSPVERHVGVGDGAGPGDPDCAAGRGEPLGELLRRQRRRVEVALCERAAG